ncbi:MAG: sigma-70 family RNA polymerase sigma factor [Gemmatimonadaceae bacterium]|nr:sigma-70 family RNA polymerase sigma factor [Gemmatimonadaceae bacterium]
MPADPQQAERETIEACRRGDLDAYERLFREHWRRLLGVAVRMLGDPADAEDAVQTAFIRLHRGIGRFRGESGIGTWLMRILINACHDTLRARKRRFELQPAEPAPGPGPDLRLQLEEAILTLPGRMRACFVLYAVEGFPQKEIAEMLRIREGTVKAQIFQARERLRAILTDEEDSP